MNARQKAKLAKQKEYEMRIQILRLTFDNRDLREKNFKLFSENQFIRKYPIEVTPGLCKHRAVCRIYPDNVHLISDLKFLDCIAANLAREFTQVIRDNMRIEDYGTFEGQGKIAVFDMMYYMKGGDT